VPCIQLEHSFAAMSGSRDQAKMPDAQPPGETSRPLVALQKQDVLKNIVVNRLNSATTEILPPEARAAMKLSMKRKNRSLMIASAGNESLSSQSTHAALQDAISSQSSHAVLEYANIKTETETAKASAAKAAIAETKIVGASNPLHPTKSQVWRCDLHAFGRAP
jgi:hypothetical protein